MTILCLSIIILTELFREQNIEITAADIPELTSSITFGRKFNQLIRQNVQPNTIKYIDLEWIFNHPIGPNVIPNSLIHIKLGMDFNHPIVEGDLPNFNKEISPNSLPGSIESIVLEIILII